MAAMFVKIALSALLILCLIGQGMAKQKCSIKQLVVKTVVTNKSVKGKPVNRVTITNNCECGQVNVLVDCTGFQSALAINPRVFTKVDDRTCLVHNAGIINPHGGSFSFLYAWDKQFSFNPISSETDFFCQ